MHFQSLLQNWMCHGWLVVTAYTGFVLRSVARAMSTIHYMVGDVCGPWTWHFHVVQSKYRAKAAIRMNQICKNTNLLNVSTVLFFFRNVWILVSVSACFWYTLSLCNFANKIDLYENATMKLLSRLNNWEDNRKIKLVTTIFIKVAGKRYSWDIAALLSNVVSRTSARLVVFLLPSHRQTRRQLQ